jgi:hypothetical protein
LSASPEEATEVNDLKDKPIRELNSGDVRKLVIAISYCGTATIILLGTSLITSLVAQKMDCPL